MIQKQLCRRRSVPLSDPADKSDSPASVEGHRESPARSAPIAPRLSVVIPAFEEATRLPATLQRVLAYLRAQDEAFEVVVADDGSSDETAELARAAGVEVKVVTIAHAGKGAAVRAGVLASSGDLVLITDADLSTPIHELDPLRRALQAGAGLAVGSRRLAASRVELKQPAHRRLMGRAFNLLVRVLVVREVHDTQCGFKLFRGALAREVFSLARVDGFAFDVEAILLTRQLGGRVAEVPVAWHDAAHSRVSAVRDSAAMFAELLAIRRRARRSARQPAAGVRTLVRGPLLGGRPPGRPIQSRRGPLLALGAFFGYRHGSSADRNEPVGRPLARWPRRPLP